MEFVEGEDVVVDDRGAVGVGVHLAPPPLFAVVPDVEDARFAVGENPVGREAQIADRPAERGPPDTFVFRTGESVSVDVAGGGDEEVAVANVPRPVQVVVVRRDCRPRIERVEVEEVERPDVEVIADLADRFDRGSESRVLDGVDHFAGPAIEDVHDVLVVGLGRITPIGADDVLVRDQRLRSPGIVPSAGEVPQRCPARPLDRGELAAVPACENRRLGHRQRVALELPELVGLPLDRSVGLHREELLRDPRREVERPVVGHDVATVFVQRPALASVERRGRRPTLRGRRVGSGSGIGGVRRSGCRRVGRGLS